MDSNEMDVPLWRQAIPPRPEGMGLPSPFSVKPHPRGRERGT
jgi:hypothetical protein